MKLLKNISFFFFLVIFCMFNQLHASEQYQVCAACHGAQAEGNAALSAPVLAGLDAGYLERQLQHFKSGIRGRADGDTLGAQMAAMAANLNEQQINQLALEISQLPSPDSNQVSGNNGDANKGKKYFLSNCAACHSNQAQGNEQLNAPVLNSQDEQYLLRQIKHFRNGLRGAHSEDQYGRQMAMMAKTLPDDQAVTDVVAFILTL